VLGGRQNDGLDIQAIQDLNFHDTGYAIRMRLGAIQNVAVDNGDGSFDVTFYRALPADFTGDVAIALGGHPAWQTTDQNGMSYYERGAAVSAVYFPGAGKREAAFDSANCNACHNRLIRHGSNRNGNYEFCLICHNGDAAVCDSNIDPNPGPDGSCPEPPAMEGFHFGRMIHSIHSSGIAVGGIPSENATFLGGAFTGVTFPQSAANCEVCHKPGLYNTARATARAVSTDYGADIRVWTDDIASDIASTPNAAVCGVCHTSTAARGHFESQAGQVDDLKCTIVGATCGDPLGVTGSGLPNGQEACAVCHGTGSEFETSKFHNPGIE
jgi:OmcA/MtrC family decaheme c-type cytochrome